MLIALTVLREVLSIFIYGMQIAMLIRAILSWIPMDSNKFTDFIHIVTEPIIVPFRVLFDKMNWFSGLPIDMSFSAAVIALLLLSIII